jgi:FkbM family methyltransferase
MLIKIQKLIEYFKINITGILHIGAHECEELDDYNNAGILNENIYWIEAMQNKVDKMKLKNNNINIYQALIDEKENKEVDFKITNNGESSSILDFGTHREKHPHVKVIDIQKLKTTRIDTIIEKYNIPIKKINFMNLDIQGVELRALKSMNQYLKDIEYIYTEVNIEEVYKNCDQMNELDSYLNKFGFKRVTQYIYTQYGWGDAFYMKIK